MIKSHKISLLDQEINTILFLLDSVSESTEGFLAYSEDFADAKSLKEYIRKIVNGEEI